MFEYLEGRTPKIIDEDKLKLFAVMVCVTECDGEPCIVFEKRAGTLRRQPGEVCLPGGARKSGETAQENAVRETTEELCIDRSQISVRAQMDSLVTSYDNKLDVFLCELSDYKMTYSESEVGEIFTVPVRFFLENEPDVYVNEIKTVPAKDFPYDKLPEGVSYGWRSGHRNVYFYFYNDQVIWGMTAYIMQSVAKIINNEKPRE